MDWSSFGTSLAEGAASGLLSGGIGALLAPITASIQNASQKNLMDYQAKVQDHYQRSLMLDQGRLQKHSLLQAGLSAASLGSGFGNIANSSVSSMPSSTVNPTPVDMSQFSAIEANQAQAELTHEKAETERTLRDAQLGYIITQTDNMSQDTKNKVQEFNKLDAEIRKLTVESWAAEAGIQIAWSDLDVRTKVAAAQIEQMEHQNKLTDAQRNEVFKQMAYLAAQTKKAYADAGVSEEQQEVLRKTVDKILAETRVIKTEKQLKDLELSVKQEFERLGVDLDRQVVGQQILLNSLYIKAAREENKLIGAPTVGLPFGLLKYQIPKSE